MFWGFMPSQDSYVSNDVIFVQPFVYSVISAADHDPISKSSDEVAVERRWQRWDPVTDPLNPDGFN